MLIFMCKDFFTVVFFMSEIRSNLYVLYVNNRIIFKWIISNFYNGIASIKIMFLKKWWIKRTGISFDGKETDTKLYLQDDPYLSVL